MLKNHRPARKWPVTPMAGNGWRAIERHEVRLIPSAYLKPFVKNDAVNAEAICDTAQRRLEKVVAASTDEAQEGDKTGDLSTLRELEKA
jgi:hypothetical protein